MPNPYKNKIIYNGNTLIDLTGDTVTPGTLQQGYTAHDASGALITGTAVGGNAITVTDTADSHGGTIRTITAVDISDTTAVASDVASGKYFYTSSGTKTEGSATAPTLITKSISSNGTYSASSDSADGYSQVSVNVPTGTARTSSDLTVSGATVTVPAGLYSSQATKSVASGTAGTPIATKGTVSNHSVSVTPSVTNSTGYITGDTKTGTAVTVSASELVSGSQTITANNTYDVTNLEEVIVNISGGTYTRTEVLPSQSFTPNSNRMATLSGMTGFVDGAYYIVTYDGVEWLTTCDLLWSVDYCIGEVQYLFGTPDSACPFCVVWESGTSATVAIGNTSQHTIRVERLIFTQSGTTLVQKSITTNGTYNASSDSADGYSQVVVDVPSGGSTKNIQAYIGRASRTANSYGATAVTLTVAKTGTYDVSWTAWRSSSSGTMGTNLHVNSTSGTNQQTFTNTYGQLITLSNQSYTQGDVLTIYATSGSNSRTINVANLIIEEQ